jgi:hypothetical protein
MTGNDPENRYAPAGFGIRKNKVNNRQKPANKANIISKILDFSTVEPATRAIYP